MLFTEKIRAELNTKFLGHNIIYIPETGSTNEDAWKRKELWDAIAKLPKRQQTVVTMRIAENLPYKEIAKIMKISENSAKVNYHHAVATLKKIF